MEIAEQVSMVLLVFALLGGMLWFLKRRGVAALSFTSRKSRKTRRLEVLERVPLTAQHALHLVRVSGKTLLIGTAPTSCTLLDTPAQQDFPSSLAESMARMGE
jgi:flagellar biosynthetic protein FliO